MKVLVIGAHCDDESFGCLGALLQAKEGDAEIQFLWFTQARDTINGALKAARFFNAKWTFLGLDDQRLDTYPLVDLISPIEKIVREFKPEVVYIPFIADLNKDHRLVSEAAMVACRPYKENAPKQVFMYRIQGSTELGSREFNGLQFPIDVRNKSAKIKDWYPNEFVSGRECIAPFEAFERWPHEYR